MMTGLLVAPVAPSAIAERMRSGSTESSHALVPEATSEARPCAMENSKWDDCQCEREFQKSG